MSYILLGWPDIYKKNYHGKTTRSVCVCVYKCLQVLFGLTTEQVFTSAFQFNI